ncbi:MAG: tyrosine-type recombinase/integrase [Methanotrichaceae archaeon]|nr:tyrosine-type recombinase/integrase [Methanotrichaceae archaeon]
MDQLREAFLEDCHLRGMAEVTVLHYGYCLKNFGAYLASKEADPLHVNRDILRGFIEYLRKQGKTQKTVENYFAVLSTFYEYLAFEEHVSANPVLPVRKRYLKRYKDNDDGQARKLISVVDMGRLINSTLDIRDKAVITLLAKTGIRRHELVELDVSDVDLIENRIRLKPTAKRTNRTVFFDDECSFILRRWLKVREGMNGKGNPALFLNSEGERLNRSGIYNLVVQAAERVGLHDASSERLEDHFGPHCCRHWFCTHLFRAGMRREFIKELRGDARKEAFDLYNHIDLKELREAYLACIPQLGV